MIECAPVIMASGLCASNAFGAIRVQRGLVEAGEDDSFNSRGPAERVPHGGDRYLSGGVEGISVDARADRGKGDGFHLFGARQLERLPVGGRQKLRLALRAALPDRPDGVNDVARGQAKSWRDARIGGGTGRDAFAGAP